MRSTVCEFLLAAALNGQIQFVFYNLFAEFYQQNILQFECYSSYLNRMKCCYIIVYYFVSPL